MERRQASSAVNEPAEVNVGSMPTDFRPPQLSDDNTSDEEQLLNPASLPTSLTNPTSWFYDVNPALNREPGSFFSLC